MSFNKVKLDFLSALLLADMFLNTPQRREEIEKKKFTLPLPLAQYV